MDFSQLTSRAFIVAIGLLAQLSCVAGLETDAAVENRFKADTHAFEAAFQEFEKTAGPGQEFRYDLTPLADFLVTTMRNGADDATRFTAAAYIPMLRDYLVALPPATYVEVSRVLPPDSPLWARTPRSIGYESEGLPPGEARQYLEQMAQSHPDRATRGEALIALVRLEMRESDLNAYHATFRRLSEYKDIEALGFRISALSPDINAAIGKRAPELALPVIGHPGQVFSTRSLGGKFYLVDFWATWCGPCLAERATLQRVNRRYGGDRFAIVSVSMDKDAGIVEQYRRARWEMPWTHLFLTGGQEGEAAKAFDVDWIGLPRLVLVDSQGIIVAVQDDLGRDSLEATLARFLGD